MYYRSPHQRYHHAAPKNNAGTNTRIKVRVHAPPNIRRLVVFPGLDPEQVIYSVELGGIRKEYLNNLELITKTPDGEVMNVKRLKPDRIEELREMIGRQGEANFDVDHMLKSVEFAEELKRTRIPKERPKKIEISGYYL